MNTQNRLNQFRQIMAEKDIRASIIMNFENQFYLSGFKAIIYSRPIVLGIEQEETVLIVPGLEENHARAHADVNHLYTYYEHPEKKDSGTSYMDHLDRITSAYPAGTKIGVEFNAMPSGLSAHLSEQGYALVDMGEIIANMRFVKEDQELDMLVESGKLVSLALKKSLDNISPGITEMELDQYGNKALLKQASLEYPDATLDIFVMSPSGVERTNMPHVFSNTRVFKENEIIIHSRQVGLNGYRAECERTVFIGRPSDKQADLFKIMVEAQQVALDIIKPGIKACEVDLAARKVIQDNGYGDYSIHRTGHGIGIGLHETPFLKFDSDVLLEAGMVFSVEPGIYVPGLGGFRHSDTVILTKGGKKIITAYPSQLESLIF